MSRLGINNFLELRTEVTEPIITLKSREIGKSRVITEICLLEPHTQENIKKLWEYFQRYNISIFEISEMKKDQQSRNKY